MKCKDYIPVDDSYPCDSESFEYDERLDLIASMVPAELMAEADRKHGLDYVTWALTEAAKSDNPFYISKQWIIVRLEAFVEGAWRKDPTKAPPIAPNKVVQEHSTQCIKWAWYVGRKAVARKQGLASGSLMFDTIKVDIIASDLKPYKSMEILAEGDGPCWLVVYEV